MKAVNDFIKDLCRKMNIQFRKVDPRRSENIVLGINYNCLTTQKKILVSYMDYGRTAYSLRYARGHTNLQEMFQMIRILIDMDFCIDVCGCNNQDAALEMPSDHYDYILGFGEMFRLARSKNPGAYAILYMTENPYKVSREHEQERIDYFYERTGRKIAFARTGRFYNENDEQLADAVICLGEKRYFSNGVVHRVYPTAFKNENYVRNMQDERENTNFLVFGAKGFVHKGNDLLVEVFARHPEWQLYLCGSNISQECRKIGVRLPQNVTDCGFVNVESGQYLDLVRKCAFVLLPSCSEGMSTALMTCMRHGQIPVTMRGTGMDELAAYCEYFDGYRISQVEAKLCELASMDRAAAAQYSDRIYAYANETFVPEMFAGRFRSALEAIMEREGQI